MDCHPLWRLVGLREPSPVAGPPGLGTLAFSPTLGGGRLVSRQLVEVGDDPSQHSEHAGAVERDVLRVATRLETGPNRVLFFETCTPIANQDLRNSFRCHDFSSKSTPH